jgi:hypothetical protein
MSPKILFAVLALVLAGIGMMRVPARADAFAEEERMRRLHFDCDHGEKRACVQFGVLIGENRERHVEWRRIHPEWWWWER